MVKNLPLPGRGQETQVDPWLGKIPAGGQSNPPPVFLPGESQGPYSPQGRKESDMKEATLHAGIHALRYSL